MKLTSRTLKILLLLIVIGAAFKCSDFPALCRFVALAPTYRFYGDPERIRTSGLQIRNLPLYPAELRGREAIAES